MILNHIKTIPIYDLELKTFSYIISRLLSLIFIINPSLSVDIQCDYNDISYDIIGSMYSCNVENILNIDNQEVATIEFETGKHLSGKTNNNVQGWKADGKNLQHFPRGLTQISKQLAFGMVD